MLEGRIDVAQPGIFEGKMGLGCKHDACSRCVVTLEACCVAGIVGSQGADAAAAAVADDTGSGVAYVIDDDRLTAKLERDGCRAGGTQFTGAGIGVAAPAVEQFVLPEDTVAAVAVVFFQSARWLKSLAL